MPPGTREALLEKLMAVWSPDPILYIYAGNCIGFNIEIQR